MSQALIVFASRTGETEAIANLIAEGIRIAGHQATVVKVDMIKNERDLQNRHFFQVLPAFRRRWLSAL